MNKILFLLSVIFVGHVSAGYLYSGKVSSIAESNDHLVTYSHGSNYNVKKSEAEQYSTLKIYSKKNDSLNLVSSSNIEELLVYVDLVEDSHLILGISNLNIDLQADIFIYNLSGEKISSVKIECYDNSTPDLQIFCSRETEAGQVWIYEQLNLFEAYLKNGSVNVCFLRECLSIKQVSGSEGTPQI